MSTIPTGCPMKNSIDISTAFSFKGEVHTPSATLDLDSHMESSGSLPPFHALLASTNDIDTYSYLYEVMEMAAVQYSNAKGMAAEFLKDGAFDQAGFETAWRENKITQLLQPIARDYLGIDDIDNHTDLRAALLQAYKLGREAQS
ncbi:MAG: hypothetical protein KZQ75_04180 [Candidatus Thiodiazotropha sp. (ex Myrtea spinifera)]|nr:hypothetical protein [Candidatus Thiodiazotropha sp. (ex Myrtea spinifera)]MCU7829736.1 hypothetical protein [Candidatus Thiodiazotropha sp. (ex Myrtea sp. 'scaly one' KF741663)]